MKLRALVWMSVLAIVLGLLGCGGGGNDDTDNGGDEIPQNSGDSPGPPAEEPRTVECVPILPQDLSVDVGSSHTLQTHDYLYVDHGAIRFDNQQEGTASSAVAYADFNDDGYIDIFYAGALLEFYLNDGRGQFSLDTTFFGTDGGGSRKALKGDFNGDGRIDVFVLDQGPDEPPFPGAAPQVILSSPSGYVLGSGLNTFIEFHHGGASADIDYDGDIDVFTTGGRSFFINDGSGSFTEDATLVEGLDHEPVFTAELVDVDGDDFLDLLVAGHEYSAFPTQILWGDSTGVFSTTKATSLPSVPGRGVVIDIDVSDTDKDGDKDIVVNRTGDDSDIGFYNGYYVQLVEQAGERRFQDMTTQLVLENEDPDAN